ncbi:MAG TPA: hypothetical protein VIJ66_00020 [Solirubrobacteraceae bacterium]
MHARRPFLNPCLVGLLAVLVFVLAPAAQAAGVPAPSVATGGVSNVAYSSAILNGYVDARGELTSYYFQYGPTGAFGAQSPLAPAGNGTSSTKVSQAITGLQPGITYHYRIVASGPGGTVRGADRTFKTPKVPLSVQIVGAPNPVVFGGSFFVEGTLSGTGASTHAVVLQANPFPYVGGFKTVGNPEVTNSAGGFSFPFLGLLENAQLRVVTVGNPVVASPVVLENVAVRVAFHVRRARRRGFVRLYGTVAPAEVGALVGFQLLRPGRSVNEGGTAVTAGTASVSRFSAVVRLRHRGLYRALIKVSNDGAHVSNYSEPILIR